MRFVAAVALVLFASACGGTPPVSQTPRAASAPADATPGVNPAPDESGDWIRPAKDFASTRFSSLDQITPQSVTQLSVKGTFSTG